MLQQELQHLCQPFILTPWYSHVQQHPPSGVGYKYQPLHGCMEPDPTHLGNLCRTASVVCGDDLLVGINAYHTSCQEGELLSLIVTDSKKFLPVHWNYIQWLNTSPNPLSPFAKSVSLQAFRYIYIPDDVQSGNML